MVDANSFDTELVLNSIDLAHGRLARQQRRPDALQVLRTSREDRVLSVYAAQAGYDMQEELDFLSHRAIEPNIFFASRFLAPAMPRLDDRDIRLAIIRDETDHKSRLRLVFPFSIEKPGFSIGSPILRVWSNPFAPLATPLLDGENAAEILDDFLEALGRPDSSMPRVMVLPDVRLNGPFVQMLKAIAMSRNLAVNITHPYSRPMLESLMDGESYIRNAIKKEHVREMRRQWAKLEAIAPLSYNVARQPRDIRNRAEEFLLVEASGWKGRKRSAMLSDRLRSAFAREAINNLAETDNVRIHTLDLGDRAIASMIVFIMNGEAYTWKTAFDEEYYRFSPGKLLLAQLTDWHLDDANIVRTDSCATPDHPIMSRFWQEREEMGTLVVGLTPNADRDVRQVSAQLHLYQNTRNMARLLRQKIMSLTGR